MSHHDPEIVKKHIKIYVGVFVALAFFTALTVGVSFIHFWGPVIAVIVGLGIASTKASLVGWFFMHLGGEKKIIWFNILLAAFFFVSMLVLTMSTVREVAWQDIAPPISDEEMIAAHHDDHHGDEEHHEDDDQEDH